jgi:two-component system, response regulator
MDRNKTILLVEDNPDDAELALRAFRKINMTEGITIVRDGAEAIDWMLAAEIMPSLVLLDLQLPKVHGLDVLHRLRAEKRSLRVPIVVLSSSNEESDIQRSYELGANSFVRKPVDYSQFIETARLMKAYWLEINELPRS